MKKTKNQFLDFFKQECAPTFLEYGLLVIMIALVVVVAATAFGQAVMMMFSGVPPAN